MEKYLFKKPKAIYELEKVRMNQKYMYAQPAEMSI